MPAMHAGKLDRPVILQRAVEITNALNETILIWFPFGPRQMANRTYRTASEVLSPGLQVQATLDSRYIIRWAEPIFDLNPKDRLKDMIDGRIYEITAVLELGRQEWLEIHATAEAD